MILISTIMHGDAQFTGQIKIKHT